MPAVPEPIRSERTASYVISRVGAKQKLEAARRLVGGVGVPIGDTEAARRFLKAAEAHGINLTHLWASSVVAGALPRQVCLGVAGTGRSAMLFTSQPMTPAEEEELSRVILALCGDLSGVSLAQALLEPGERSAKSSFLSAGFRLVGCLAYMQRQIPSPAEFVAYRTPSLGTGISIRHVNDGLDDPNLILAMERSYIDTLDCPELCGLRDTRDVLISHKRTGEHDPKLWWIIELGGEPEGVMLFNPCPDQGSIELVYLGLSPKLRRRGVGGNLLRMGLAHLCGRPERTVTCAVDERNEPARRLYLKLGFADTARRFALVKPLGVRRVENEASRT